MTIWEQEVGDARHGDGAGRKTALIGIGSLLEQKFYYGTVRAYEHESRYSPRCASSFMHFLENLRRWPYGHLVKSPPVIDVAAQSPFLDTLTSFPCLALASLKLAVAAPSLAAAAAAVEVLVSVLSVQSRTYVVIVHFASQTPVGW